MNEIEGVIWRMSMRRLYN